MHDSGKTVKEEYDKQLLRQGLNPSPIYQLRMQRQMSVDDIAAGNSMLPSLGG